jgi:hypothetical protein
VRSCRSAISRPVSFSALPSIACTCKTTMAGTCSDNGCHDSMQIQHTSDTTSSRHTSHPAIQQYVATPHLQSTTTSFKQCRQDTSSAATCAGSLQQHTTQAASVQQTAACIEAAACMTQYRSWLLQQARAGQ